ncbi:MAG: GTPase [Alphaproteobacteria bacterium]
MKLRIFGAPTMTEVMAKVRDQLGADAIILSTQTDSDGHVRVTAAIDQPVEIGGDSATNRNGPSTTDPLPAIRRALVAHGIDDTIANMLLEVAHDHAQEHVSSAVAFAAALDSCFTFNPISDKPDRPIILVGPPGTGKTVTVAKLAARAHVAGQSVRVIGTDTIKAGGFAQLQQLTDALQIGLRKAEDPDDFRVAVAGCAGSDMVVVDSFGVNPFETDDIDRLQPLIAAADLEPVLVMPAGLDVIDAGEIATAFADLGCRRAVITRLDLARRFGSLLAAAHTSGLAFCDVSVSPNIGAGLRSLNPVGLARLLLPPVPSTQTNAPQEAQNP